MSTEVETAIYRLQVEGKDQIDRLTKSIDGMAVAEEKATAANRTFSQSLQNNIARLDPMIKAQEQYRKALETNARYRESGVGTEQQLNAQLSAATQKYQSQISVVSALAEAHKGLNAQGQAAFHSLRSMVEVIAMGGSPIQALTQQMNHLTFAASGEGGIAGAFKQVGAMLGPLVTNPVVMATAAIATLTATAAALALQFDKVQKSSERALIGAGARSGTTISDMNSFTQQNSSFTGLSPVESRKLAEDLTKTGDIVISKLHGMGDAVVGFATLTGSSMDEASKAMVKFATDPQRAMEELSKTYGAFSSETRKAVNAAIEAGDKAKAFQVIIDATAESNKKAADTVGFLEREWRRLVNLLATPIQSPVGLEEKLKEAQQRLTAMQANPGGEGMGGYGTAEIKEQIRLVEELKAKIEQVGADKLTAEFNKTTAEVEAAVKAQERMLPVVQAVTGAQKMAAQYAVDYKNAVDQGKDAVVATAIAVANLKTAQAAANAAVDQQIKALERATELKRVEGTSQEKYVKAAQAYDAAMESGADKTKAAALQSATLANETASAAKSSKDVSDHWNDASGQAHNFANWVVAGKDGMDVLVAGTQTLEAALRSAAYQAKNVDEAINRYDMSGYGNYPNDAAAYTADRLKNGPNFFMPGQGGSKNFSAEGGDPRTNYLLRQQAADQATGIQSVADAAYATGGVAGALAAIKAAPNTYGASFADASAASKSGYDLTAILGPERSNIADKVSAFDAIIQAQNAQTTDKGAQTANIQTELQWLKTLAPNEAVSQKIVDLTKSLDDVATSTDSLTKSNQDLLSPYYTQDPRTSHIGFRSQGMAAGGYVDVPGGYSANDNMMAMIPVASGERIYVDPNTTRRGGAGGQAITINAPVAVYGSSANKDDIGRSVYQNAQAAARQIAMASR